MAAEERRSAELRSTSGMVLSLLVDEPATPSALASAYVRRFSTLSSMSERNIRTKLKLLKAEALVEATGEGALLRITAAGTDARAAWLAAPLQPRSPVILGATALAALEPTGLRREILSRVLAAEHRDRSTIIRLLQDYHRALLQMLDEDVGHVDRDDLLVSLVLTERELWLGAEIRWVEIALERFIEAHDQRR